MPGRGYRPSNGKRPAKKGVFTRLIKLLLEDYKWHLLLVLLCIAINSVGNVMPSVFLKNITDYIEKGLATGWDSVATSAYCWP